MNLGYSEAGAFRVLLWKEWRQQRWTLLGMTALALALFVLGGFLGKRWSFGLSGAAYVFALVGVPLVLSARAFAGEDEDGTAAFLRELPFRPLRIFAAKFVVVLLASWAAAGLLLLLGWLWPGYPDNALGVIPWVTRALPERGASTGLAAIWMLAPVAAAQASLLASLGTRSLTTALLNAVCLCLCAGSAAVSAICMDELEVRAFVWASVAVVMTAAGVLLAASLSARRHPRTWVRCVRGIGGCLAVLALFLLPAALCRVYGTVLATPGAYLRPTWWRDRLGSVSAFSVPPLARPSALLLRYEFRRTPGVSQACRLDLETGRTTRVAAGVFPPRPWDFEILWSPDGSRAAWTSLAPMGDIVTIRGLTDGSKTPPPASQAPREPYGLCVYDLRAQRTTRLPGGVGLGLLHQSGNPWYNRTWLAMPWGRDPLGPGVAFVNADDGAAHFCPVSAAEGAEPWSHSFGMVVLPDGAVFRAVRQAGATEGAGSGLVIARCTPTSSAATLLRVRDPPPGALRAVSPDAKWALFVTSAMDSVGDRLDLVDLGTGATRPVASPPGVMGRSREDQFGLETARFVTGGTRILVSLPGSSAVYDIGRDTWQLYVPPGPAVPGGGTNAGSLSPNGERLLQPPATYSDAPGANRIAVLDLHAGLWTSVPLEGRAYYVPEWFGNDHILVLSASGLCLYGLDGSREVLWPRG